MSLVMSAKSQAPREAQVDTCTFPSPSPFIFAASFYTRFLRRTTYSYSLPHLTTLRVIEPLTVPQVLLVVALKYFPSEIPERVERGVMNATWSRIRILGACLAWGYLLYWLEMSIRSGREARDGKRRRRRISQRPPPLFCFPPPSFIYNCTMMFIL